MKKILILILLFSKVYAQDFTPTDEKASQAEALKKYGQSISALSSQAQSNANKYLNYAQNLAQKIKHPERLKKPPAGFMIFVSLSMPTESLRALILQASVANIPVVIRGLVNNSLKDTATRLTEITGKVNRGGVLVDPLWFKHFNINAVPAFVSNNPHTDCPKNMSCPDNAFDVVYGNVSLKTALEFMENHGYIGTDAIQNTLHKLETSHA